MFPCYSLDVRLLTARTCLQNAKIQCSSGLSLTINCEKRKTSITYGSENSVSETTAFGLSGILAVLLLANNSVEAVFRSGLHVSNDFVQFTIPGREIALVQRMLVRRENSV